MSLIFTLLKALFGEGFWDHVVMGVSHWAYDKRSQDIRKETGKNETWWMDDMNVQLHEKFHLEQNLTAVFIDSWAKKDFNLNDPLQQEAFDRETEKLWTIISNNPTFEFKTIQDVLEENRRLKEENKWLNDVITNNISEIMEQLAQQTDDIEDLREKDVNFSLSLGIVTVDIEDLREKDGTMTDDIKDLREKDVNFNVSIGTMTDDIKDLREKDVDFNVSLGTLFDKQAEDISNVEGHIVGVKTELSEDITKNITSVTNNIVEIQSELTDDINEVISDISELVIVPVGKL